MNDEILNKLSEALQKEFDKAQDRPDQYVVAYYKLSDESLIGYHSSSFCQLTQDILNAKRYAGDDPYGQLKIIAKNAAYTLDSEFDKNGMFYELHMSIREEFGGLKSNDIYMDVVYLAEGTPKQSFRMKLINPE